MNKEKNIILFYKAETWLYCIDPSSGFMAPEIEWCHATHIYTFKINASNDLIPPPMLVTVSTLH